MWWAKQPPINVGDSAIYANEQKQCWMVELHVWDRYDKPFA